MKREILRGQSEPDVQKITADIGKKLKVDSSKALSQTILKLSI